MKAIKSWKYCIQSDSIKTLVPQYAIFDGNDWVDWVDWVDIPPFFLREGGRLGFYE